MRRHCRQLGHMTDHHSPAASVFFGQLADEVHIHRLGCVADVEMDVDVDVVIAGEFEDSSICRHGRYRNAARRQSLVRRV